MLTNENKIAGGRTAISIVELRKLLAEIKDGRPDIQVRYRLIGEMWSINFLTIVNVTSRGVLFYDNLSNKLIALSDLSCIVQIEIDNRFRDFQPHFHYDVTLTSTVTLIK